MVGTFDAMKSAIGCQMPYSKGYNLEVMQRIVSMAKQNYSYEKRQKEIAKKKKKEEKRLKKAGVDENQPQGDQPISENDDK